MASSSKRQKATERTFEAGPWKISVRKSHILKSVCEGGEQACRNEPCHVCRFQRELRALPALPEMVFPDSWLRLDHVSGCGLAFYALDALRRVDTTQDPLRVAAADDWRQSRGESLAKLKGVVKPFDWTFTTDYTGTLLSLPHTSIQVEETSEGIDYSQLKQQERIHFYDDVILYEDELADNGTAVLSAKIRVMASGFYILTRFFLRVDGVIVRLNDTRIYHQAGTDFLTRELCSKEARIPDLKVPTTVLTDPDKLNNILPANKTLLHRLILPK
jgi:type 2A phosphatase activator TIP41